MRRRANADSLGDAVVDPDGGQILGNEPLLAVTFDNAALQNKQSGGGELQRPIRLQERRSDV